MTTDKQRWDGALNLIRTFGVQIAPNVNSCCAGCIDEAKDLPVGWDQEAPYIFWLRTQGRAIKFDEYGRFYRPEKPRRFLSWQNMTTVQISAVCLMLRDSGLDVTVPKDSNHAIEINFGGTA